MKKIIILISIGKSTYMIDYYDLARFINLQPATLKARTKKSKNLDILMRPLQRRFNSITIKQKN